MKKLLFAIVTAAMASAFCSSSAQDADRILDGLLQTLSENGISCSGTLSSAEFDNVPVSLVMKGERYCISLPETTYWFDGKTGWNGIKDDGNILEVYIQEPDADDFMSNPFVLLRQRSAFSVSAPDSKTLKLTAKDRQKGVNGALDLTILLDEKGNPSEISFTMLVSEAATGTLRFKIARYATSGITDDALAFSMEDYPDVEIIDLR